MRDLLRRVLAWLAPAPRAAVALAAPIAATVCGLSEPCSKCGKRSEHDLIYGQCRGCDFDMRLLAIHEHGQRMLVLQFEHSSRMFWAQIEADRKHRETMRAWRRGVRSAQELDRRAAAAPPPTTETTT